MMKPYALFALFAAASLAAPKEAEEPVGVMLTATPGSYLIRWNTKAPLPARPGDLLFTGDRLRTGDKPASFLFCPTPTSQQLEPLGEVVFEAKKITVDRGTISNAQPRRGCLLPKVLRMDFASLQRFGGMTVRDVTTSPSLWPKALGRLDAKPVFQFEPVAGATSYQFELAKPNGGVVFRTTSPKPSFEYSGSELAAGGRYFYSVVALEGQQKVASAGALFHLLSEPERAEARAELARLVKEGASPEAMLQRAALYERSGQVDEAVAEYQKLAEIWRESAWLRGKRVELQKQRGVSAIH
ncbi:MAG: tetratricopeptide repeat protein [Bryobacteraceae bacterium]|nr:tetratricopeptide repeat protein [Bryobacteraceae bacterium]